MYKNPKFDKLASANLNYEEESAEIPQSAGDDPSASC